MRKFAYSFIGVLVLIFSFFMQAKASGEMVITPNPIPDNATPIEVYFNAPCDEDNRPMYMIFSPDNTSSSTGQYLSCETDFYGIQRGWWDFAGDFIPGIWHFVKANLTPSDYDSFGVNMTYPEVLSEPYYLDEDYSVVLLNNLLVTTTSINNLTLGTPYSQYLRADGGVPEYTWQVATGTLPLDLSLSSSGVLSGTPTEPGIYNFTVEVSDASSTVATSTFSVRVNNKISISTRNLPDGKVDYSYSKIILTNGGTDPLSWSLGSGSLPAGLSLDSNSGNISGIPTTAGTSNFSIEVEDANGNTNNIYLHLTIEP